MALITRVPLESPRAVRRRPLTPDWIQSGYNAPSVKPFSAVDFPNPVGRRYSDFLSLETVAYMPAPLPAYRVFNPDLPTPMRARITPQDWVRGSTPSTITVKPYHQDDWVTPSRRRVPLEGFEYGSIQNLGIPPIPNLLALLHFERGESAATSVPFTRKFTTSDVYSTPNILQQPVFKPFLLSDQPLPPIRARSTQHESSTAFYVLNPPPPPPTPTPGPPVNQRYIPPQNGRPVTFRNFSWLELAERAWGSEFRQPDHRIYEFSNGRGFDSTDQYTTGIYSPAVTVPSVLLGSVNSGNVTLSWSQATIPNSPIASYAVWRSVNAGAFSLLHTFGATVLTYIDSSLVSGTYAYFVVAQSVTGAQSQSNLVTLTF